MARVGGQEVISAIPVVIIVGIISVGHGIVTIQKPIMRCSKYIRNHYLPLKYYKTIKP